MEEFDSPPVADDDKLSALNKVLEEGIALEQLVEQMEEDLKATKKSLHHLKAVRVPELLDQLGIEMVKFQGWVVDLHDYVSGSLPKDEKQREAALRWIEENGGAGLIKSDVRVTFGREELEKARALAEEMANAGYRMDFSTGVHSQTLLAFVRELIRDGKPFDADLLGVYAGKVARFKKAA